MYVCMYVCVCMYEKLVVKCNCNGILYAKFSYVVLIIIEQACKIYVYKYR